MRKCKTEEVRTVGQHFENVSMEYRKGDLLQKHIKESLHRILVALSTLLWKLFVLSSQGINVLKEMKCDVQAYY